MKQRRNIYTGNTSLGGNQLLGVVEEWIKLILVAQDQVLPFRNYKLVIITEEERKIVGCVETEMKLMHLTSEHKKLAQGEYKNERNQVSSIILCEQCALDRTIIRTQNHASS